MRKVVKSPTYPRRTLALGNLDDLTPKKLFQIYLFGKSKTRRKGGREMFHPTAESSEDNDKVSVF